MAAIALTVNGQPRRFDGDPDQPLLWFLRDGLRLTGTKFGCGVAQCGACTVHVNGKAARACTVTMAAAADKSVTTIEGLEKSGVLHPVQQAWINADVPQCGYCQAGQIMAAVDLLNRKPQPVEADIATITNLCRCGTHVRIKAAIADAARRMKAAEKKS
ncbi:MAG: (2Fe-2S)-binding protein [Betaproteobacteria bacterium]